MDMLPTPSQSCPAAAGTLTEGRGSTQGSRSLEFHQSFPVKVSKPAVLSLPNATALEHSSSCWADPDHKIIFVSTS